MLQPSRNIYNTRKEYQKIEDVIPILDGLDIGSQQKKFENFYVQNIHADSINFDSIDVSNNITAGGNITADGDLTINNIYGNTVSAKTFYQTGGVTNLCCDRVVDFTLSNNSWNTVFDKTVGEGKIKSFWFLIDKNSSSATPRGVKIRITFDDASTPQFFGSNGNGLEGLCGPGFNSIDGIYMNSHHNVSENNDLYSGMIRIDMPFQSSFKIELFCPNGTQDMKAWITVEYEIGYSPIKSLDPRYNWILYGKIVSINNLGPGVDFNILNTSGGDVVGYAALAGFYHFFQPSYGGYQYLDSSYRLSSDGFLSTFFQTTSTSSMVFASNNASTFATKYSGIVYNKEGAGGDYRYCCYRFFYGNFPQGQPLFFQWRHALSSSGNVTSDCSVFFYVRQGERV